MSQVLGDASLLGEAASADLRVEKTKEFLTNALPVAVANMLDLACNAESENVRLGASKYLIDKVIKDAKPEEVTEFSKLIERLQVSS
jgi:hypothetical protein